VYGIDGWHATGGIDADIFHFMLPVRVITTFRGMYYRVHRCMTMKNLIAMILGIFLLSAGPAFAAQFPISSNAPSGNGTSYNWAGYEATGGGYTSVNGTWNVPSVSSPAAGTADATWVGIGGVTGDDLIQAGTQTLVEAGGQIVYQAFYELLPGDAQSVPLAVRAGDSISASITQTSAGQWLITLRDNTTGQWYQANVSYASALSSAEWIEEMPSTTGNVFIPLDNFNTISFTGGSAIENGSQVTIAGSGAQMLEMVNDNQQPLATPSGLGVGGESFTVTRSANAPTEAATGAVRVGGTRGHWRTGTGVRGYIPQPQQPQTSGFSRSTHQRLSFIRINISNERFIFLRF
jgi:hypothetical protein